MSADDCGVSEGSKREGELRAGFREPAEPDEFHDHGMTDGIVEWTDKKQESVAKRGISII